MVGAFWDFLVYQDSDSTAGALVGASTEYIQNSLKDMLPPPARPYAHAIVEIYQTGFREIFYQLGK